MIHLVIMVLYITNPKLAGFLNPKPMKVTVYMTVDQWSNTMPLTMASMYQGVF